MGLSPNRTGRAGKGRGLVPALAGPGRGGAWLLGFASGLGCLSSFFLPNTQISH